MTMMMIVTHLMRVLRTMMSSNMSLITSERTESKVLQVTKVKKLILMTHFNSTMMNLVHQPIIIYNNDKNAPDVSNNNTTLNLQQ